MSGEERREVAARLRDDDYCYGTEYGFFLRALGIKRDGNGPCDWARVHERLADLIDPVCDGWHTDPPEDERFVLCQGERGGFFVGRYQAHGGMEFYVPNYRGGYRQAVAWHELPEPYGGDANGDE